MNDEDFGAIGLLRLKCRRGDKMIHTFCKIGSPQKVGPTSLICRIIKVLTKVLLNHAECTDI